MADDPSVYGSYMNFFLPRSAQVGGPSLVPTPGLFDMMGGMGLGGWGGSSQPDQPGQSGTPADQQKKQQQNLAMAQQGIKMMYPQQPAQPAPPPVPVAAAAATAADATRPRRSRRAPHSSRRRSATMIRATATQWPACPPRSAGSIGNVIGKTAVNSLSY